MLLDATHVSARAYDLDTFQVSERNLAASLTMFFPGAPLGRQTGVSRLKSQMCHRPVISHALKSWSCCHRGSVRWQHMAGFQAMSEIKLKVNSFVACLYPLPLSDSRHKDHAAMRNLPG